MSEIQYKRKLSVIDQNIPLHRAKNVPDGRVKKDVPGDGQENNPKKMKLDQNKLIHTEQSIKYETNNYQSGESQQTSCKRNDSSERRETIEKSVSFTSSSSSETNSTVSTGTSVDSIASAPFRFNRRAGLSVLTEDDEFYEQDIERYLRIKRDEENLLFCTDYMEDIILNEYSKKWRRNLSRYCTQFEITAETRRVLVNWLVSVQIYTRTLSITFHLAVDLMDTLLHSTRVPFQQLQVAAAAAFWVAYKAMDNSMKVGTMLKMLNNDVTKDMLFQHEVNVIKASKGLYTDGDVTVFINYFLYKMFGRGFPPELYYCTHYLVDIMLHFEEFLDLAAADKAAVSVYTTLSLFDTVHRFGQLIKSPYIDRQIVYRVKPKLLKALACVNRDQTYHVYKKYKSSKYYRISLHVNVQSVR